MRFESIFEIQRSINECRQTIETGATASSHDIVKAALTIFMRYYYMYRAPEAFRTLLCDNYKTRVIHDTNLEILARFSFLRFLDNQVRLTCATEYWNTEVITIEWTHRLQVARILVNSSEIDSELKAAICAQLEDIARRYPDSLIRYNAIDILLNSDKAQWRALGVELLDVERNQRIPRNARDMHGPRFAVHNDSQNVHNSDINSSAIASAKKLVNEYTEKHGAAAFIQFDFDGARQHIRSINSQRAELDDALDRLMYDTADFGDGINLFNTFVCVYSKVKDNADHMLRLIDELSEMNGYCSTGHMVRLVNVLSGLDITGYESVIQISDTERYRVILSSIIQNAIESAPQSVQDQVLDSMVDNSNRAPYYDFLFETIQSNMNKLCAEYSNIKEHVASFLRWYTKNETLEIPRDILGVNPQ